ncbi:COG4223 family protein [Hyphococcus lacteus]|uniref:Mitofilin family membrane protein n=1 Tax=Hyphococcus lacteus TaxID=3143536 RepID=A0ABV3Z343_9PROT
MTQDDNKPDQKDSDDAIPEVEAEVVSGDEPVSAPFDDEPSSEADPAKDAETEPATKRKSTLTPGVMLFLLFAVVALAAFGFWRMQMRADQPDAAKENTVLEGAEPIIEPKADVATPPVAVEPAPEPEKTINVPADDLKSAPGNAVGDDAPGDVASDDGFLPPLPSDEKKLGNSFDDDVKSTQEIPAEVGEESTLDTEEVVTEPLEDAVDATDEHAVIDEPIEAPQPIEDNEMAEAAIENEPAIISDAEEPSVPATTDYSDEIAALKAEFDQQAQSLSAALAQEREKNDALIAEIGALRQDLSSALSSRDAQINQELNALRAAVSDLKDSQPKISAAQIKAGLSLDTLKIAIDQGTPFAKELADVTALAPDLTASLSTHAQSGIPTITTLRNNFDAAARRAVSAAAQEKAGGGVAGLVARAKNLVSVRPAAPRAGDGAGAILSRAEAALDDGDVAYALSEVENLSEAAQESMASWINDARARANAAATIKALEARLANAAE